MNGRVAVVVVVVAVAALGPVARAQVRAHAARRTGAVTIDGRLDEAAWTSAPQQRGFTQRFPNEAAPPSLDTRFSVLYDDEAVYVGIWADDPHPDLIVRRLTRRDVDAQADSVTVEIDSYHDRRTAYAFQLNAAGVQRDVLLSDDTNSDDTWDAVWTGDVAITATGWTAEYRIPLSQLRFANADAQEWGFQVLRSVGRTGEQDVWSPWPRSTPQVVSKFGVLEGIHHLQTTARLEVLPYVTGGFERDPVADGDPLNQSRSWARNVGLDLKYGLGPAFTLSATFNPDFGQVEADPSKINLSDNELFFAEKRPFFLEASDLFKLDLGSNDEGAFYSRRIGATPADPAITFNYIKKPQSTTIYGAAKLTGKTSSGWSVGVLDAVSGGETAEVIVPPADDPGTSSMPDVREDISVAALTNFAVARVKRDFGDGSTSLGWSATSVHRDVAGTPLEAALHDQAYTGGMQLSRRWADNVWTANVNLIGSWIHGSADSIAATQRDPIHYFQRPDASDVHLDATRTSMAGLGARWSIGALGDTQHWRFGTGGDLRTPGLELNDAGFQLTSDRVVPFVTLQYHEDSPGSHLLNWGVSSDVFWTTTFEPRLVDYGIEYTANAQLANYWQVLAGGNFDRRRWATSALRGGAALRVDPASFQYVAVTTDVREPVWFQLYASGNHDWTSSSSDATFNAGATIQARSNLDVFIGSTVYLRNDPMQYVTLLDTDMSHYIFARVHESDLAMTVRVNCAFSPHLSLQVYAQPFLASVRYDEFKEVDHPAADRYLDRFRKLGSDDYAFLGSGQAAPLVFLRPDFNFRQLRSNVVLRWEYRPGSTVFAIWSHGQTDTALDDGRLRFGHDISALGSAASQDVVMLKANYWIGL